MCCKFREGKTTGCNASESVLSCPYAFIESRSNVKVIWGYKFLRNKSTGRNESEPMCRLVTSLLKPTLWSEGEGRRDLVFDNGSARLFNRGSRVGMPRKMINTLMGTGAVKRSIVSSYCYKARWTMNHKSIQLNERKSTNDK